MCGGFTGRGVLDQILDGDVPSKFQKQTRFLGGHWGFADSGYQPTFGAEMRKLNIISADCGHLLDFAECGYFRKINISC